MDVLLLTPVSCVVDCYVYHINREENARSATSCDCMVTGPLAVFSRVLMWTQQPQRSKHLPRLLHLSGTHIPVYRYTFTYTSYQSYEAYCMQWFYQRDNQAPPLPRPFKKNIYLVYIIFHIGWVGVGRQRHCKTCRSLRALDNQGTAFFLGGRLQLVVELDHLCEVKNLYSAQGECSYHVVFMVRHPRGNFIVLPLLSLEVATPENKLTH